MIVKIRKRHALDVITAQLRMKETWGFLLKLIFCAVFYLGIDREFGINMGVAPIIVLGSLAVYWKFVRHRFIR